MSDRPLPRGSLRGRRRSSRPDGHQLLTLRPALRTLPARGNATEDSLSHRDLKVARQPGPGPPCIHRQLGVLLPGSEAKELLQEPQPLGAVAPCGLQNHSAELKVRSNEPPVVLRVLARSVGIRRLGNVQVLDAEGTGDGHVHSQTLGVLPTRQSHVPWPTPWPIAKDAPLLQRGRQQPFFSDPRHEVANPVVAHNDVSLPFAARGVIAVTVKRLHAKRTLNIIACHAKTQTIPHRRAKHLRGHAAVRAVHPRRDRSHPSPRVLFLEPSKPLLLPLRRTLAHQPRKNRLIGSQRVLGLGA